MTKSMILIGYLLMQASRKYHPAPKDAREHVRRGQTRRYVHCSQPVSLALGAGSNLFQTRPSDSSLNLVRSLP